MNSRNPSARESCFPGLHPGYFSRIPNRLIGALLQSQQKPWPDTAVWLYLYSLVGFGGREFPVQTREGRRFFIELESGEFICSAKKLAELSGRSRSTVRKLIEATAVEVKRIHKSGLPVYRLRNAREQGKQQNRGRVGTPHISWDNAVINIRREHPTGQIRCTYKREYIEKRKERKSVDNSFLNGDHAAHDPKERRKGKAMKLGDCLPVRTEPRKPTVRKERALQHIAELRDKIPGDYLLELMRRYGITREELDAACAQVSCEV